MPRTTGMSYVLQPAAERVDHQLLGQRPHEHIRVLRAAPRAARPTPSPRAAVGHGALGVRPRRRPRASRHAPTASKFSSANPSGSIVPVAARARRVGAMLSIRSRIVLGARPAVCSNGGTLAGGAGGGVPSRFSRIHLPRSVGAVRSACDVASRMLPLPSSPRRASSVERHAAELAAVDVRHAVVLRQPLVDERVVGGQQVEHVAVLAHDAGEEELGLARGSASRRSLSKSGNSSVFGAMFCRLRMCSHCPAKFSHERVGASGRRACAAPAPRAPPAGAGGPPPRGRAASSSGMLLHRKNDSRDASSTSLTRYAVAGRDRGRVLFDAEDEGRARQQPPQRELDAGVEAALLAAVAIEREQRRQVADRRPAADRRGARASSGCAARMRLRAVGGSPSRAAD